jgi:formate-dependent nitrite reductase membrane component NrfD
MLVCIAVFVLFAAYLATRNNKYLSYIKQVLGYTGWLAIVLGLLFLISRVIRI